ncbi:MAG: alpha/beta fold hydrolase [Chloroflexi bacterium]|nr:alpha/beta fold hydrolase [Chloroflexota bacterium]
MNTPQIILVLIIAALSAGFVYQTITAQRERQRYQPPDQMVDVGGYRLHVDVMGQTQSTPIVILDVGMISFSSNWAWVQLEVAKGTCVVAYDRAGLGWSDPAPTPRDAGRAAQELHTALEKLGISGPYVLAGHSYGGLTIRAFAALYRDQVAGMVLVDGSHPDQWVQMGISSKAPGMGNKVSALLARFGVWRIFNSEYKLLANGLPQQQYAELMAFAPTPRALSSGGDALRVWDSVSRPLVNNAGDLGDLPLIVLSVTEQPRLGDKLTELQAELPHLSTNRQHITVQGAYHEGLISQEKYAYIVTDAILRMVEAARTGMPLKAQMVVEA